MAQTKVLLVGSLQRIDGLLICNNLVPSGKNYDDFHSMPSWQGMAEEEAGIGRDRAGFKEVIAVY
ncbi:hypothetical protein OX459_01075 [Janthinobacterium sp. SUN026]|uniref:hypothetical protein n=1 Tax=Janthinobacterium sp. SUN026 TaxID=3002438 RepID=UPI0025B07242|nr:hypothetical protein [Janthinobacterium sp. SUN026]MDN2669979.1 hypothetical protein [Janthinobacterium sp. SUN026]